MTSVFHTECQWRVVAEVRRSEHLNMSIYEFIASCRGGLGLKAWVALISLLTAATASVGAEEHLRTNDVEQVDPSSSVNKRLPSTNAPDLAETRMKAEQGDALAQYNLGIFYRKGEGVAKDPKEAFKWLSRSAEQGDARSMAVAAMMCAAGEGVERDFKRAAEFATRAARLGDAKGETFLAMLCFAGDGVEKDAATALSWARKAADQGLDEAQYLIGEIYTHGGKGVTADQVQAATWYRRAAEQGNAKGQAELGRRFAEGSGVPRNSQAALLCLGKAAAAGDAKGELLERK